MTNRDCTPNRDYSSSVVWRLNHDSTLYCDHSHIVFSSWLKGAFDFLSLSLLAGAPGQPIIYKPEFDTEITETSFTLKWKRPDDTGGDDDIEYIVRYREEPKNETPGPWKEVKTWRLEYDVEDLEQNTYRFEVFAQNKGGKSSASQRIVTVSPTQGINCLIFTP